MNTQIGNKVWVYAMGSYYAGTIVKHGTKTIDSKPQRVQVEYTSGAGKTRQKWLNAQDNGQYAEKYLTEFPLVEIVEGQAKPQGSRGRKPEDRVPNIYEKAQAARGGKS
jgi:hypothetical protein